MLTSRKWPEKQKKNTKHTHTHTEAYIHAHVTCTHETTTGQYLSWLKFSSPQCSVCELSVPVCGGPVWWRPMCGVPMCSVPVCGVPMCGVPVCGRPVCGDPCVADSCVADPCVVDPCIAEHSNPAGFPPDVQGLFSKCQLIYLTRYMVLWRNWLLHESIQKRRLTESHTSFQ